MSPAPEDIGVESLNPSLGKEMKDIGDSMCDHIDRISDALRALTPSRIQFPTLEMQLRQDEATAKLMADMPNSEVFKAICEFGNPETIRKLVIRSLNGTHHDRAALGLAIANCYVEWFEE